MQSAAIDKANEKFWDELCGSSLARALGITDRSAASLKKFDDTYLGYYPYLLTRVPVAEMRGCDVLEIGLGYGTLSQAIASSGARYNGLDIAQAPVDIVNERLRMLGLESTARRGSILQCPYPDSSMDCVVSIGCFHHTGDTQRCIDESFRVLRKGGRAYVMVYNRYSYRQWCQWPLETAQALFGTSTVDTAQRAAYDSDAAGNAAPETQFFSKTQLRKMFGQYSSFQASRENCEDFIWRNKIAIERKTLLPIAGPLCGLDIYVTAVK